MSLLKRIFGGKSWQEHRGDAEGWFDSGDFGQAKLAYDRALDGAKGEPEETKRALRERIDECLDGIARLRIDEAKRLLEQDSHNEAVIELEGAIETAADPKLAQEAQIILDAFERDEALAAAENVEVTDEDRLQVLAGTWEEEQADEYEEYGDALFDALVALQKGDVEAPLQTLEEVLEEAEEPRYLWYEVGRGRFLAEDEEGGEEAIDAFLEVMDDDEGGEARLRAHILLADLAEKREDVEAAIAELERAAEALDEDPRPLLALGSYLRRKERPEQAVEVLALAADAGESSDWQILQELGLAQADAGESEDAIETLEGVIAFFTARRRPNQPPDFPATSAVRLAELHEEAGRPQRAADLYSALSQGSDRARHAEFHREAGRLLLDLDLEDEGRRMLKRALAIAEDRQATLNELDADDEDIDADALETAKERIVEEMQKIEELLADI